MEILGHTNETEAMHEQMVEFAEEQSKQSKKKDAIPKYNKEVINTFADAIIYKPTNLLGSKGTVATRTYLEGGPQALPAYLHEFKCDGTVIGDRPSVIECKGCLTNGSARHKFLGAETYYICKDCKACVCEYCSQSDGKEHRCLRCHVIEALLPGVNLNEIMTVTQMREELKDKYSSDGVANLSIEEVEEIWEQHALRRAIEELTDKVEFPGVLPTSALADGDKWKELAEIDFSFGGASSRILILKKSTSQQYSS